MHVIKYRFSILLFMLGLVRCGGGDPPVIDVGLDMSDASDMGADANVRPENAPRIPRTFIELYGDIVNHQNTAPSNFTPERLTIVDGKVLDDEGAPLVDVKISAPDFPEIGHVFSNTDGNFSFALNGGGVVNLRYTKTGFIDSERRVHSIWHEFVKIGPLVLKEYSPTVTAIDFSSATQTQVARGDVETDYAGDRQATLLVNSNTNATLRLKDGTTVDMPTLNIRLTEFTVGEAGPLAMPGDLPGTSAYTYAVEISADEALSMDAVSVEFDKPVYFYLDDFLGFPVGTVVPIGYYSREKHAWIPSDNGKVISIISIANGKATVDIDGDGTADTGTALTDLGFTDDELIQLAALYTVGKVLWRGPMTHLTPWDHNWPYGLGSDALAPEDFKNPDDPNDDPCKEAGSIIECESKILRESIDVPGTPFYLNYSSYDHEFLPAYDILIPMVPQNVPGSLNCVYASVEVGGNIFQHGLTNAEIHDVSIDKLYKFRWDGKDKMGRELVGQQPYKAKLIYVYDLVYYRSASDRAQAFSNAGGGPGNYIATQPRVDPNKDSTIYSGSKCAINPRGIGGNATIAMTIGLTTGKIEGHIGRLTRGHDLAGWTLSAHHRFDQKTNTMHLGNGSRLQTRAANFSIVAGNGLSGLISDGQYSNLQPLGTNSRILEIKSDGTLLSDFAAASLNLPSLHYLEHRRDGRTYLSPELRYEGNPISYQVLKVGQDDSVYLSDARRIFRENKGVIEGIVVPTSTTPVPDSYEGPAKGANLGYIHDLVIAKDGMVYVLATESTFSRQLVVWRITQDGFVNRVYGSFSSFEFATQSGQSGLLLDSRDRLHIYTSAGVVRVDDDGTRVQLLGGSVVNKLFDGLVGTEIGAQIRGPRIDNSDRIYFSRAFDDGRVFVLEKDKRIHYLAGKELGAYQDDFYLHPTGDAKFFHHDAVFNAQNEFIILEKSGYIAKIQDAKSDRFVLSESGDLRYSIDAFGKHLETRDTLTGHLVYRFSYDGFDRLLTITDTDGLTTTIERDTQGDPIAIVGPYGHRTTMRLNTSGILKSLTNAANEKTDLTYDGRNLIASLTNPNGGTKSYRFDTDGRLTVPHRPTTLSKLKQGFVKTLRF